MPTHPPTDQAAEAPRPHRGHDDAPDTTALFARLAGLADGPERDVLRAELTTAWLPMAHRIAGRFRDRGENAEDLRQVAALGLVKAIDRFDPARGAFESYAVPTITGEVKRHFRDRTWALRVPRRVQELRNQVRVARRDLVQRPGGATPTVAGIAGHTGLTEEEVTTGLTALDSYRTISLDAEPPGDGGTLAETLGGPDPAYTVVIDREAAKRSLGRLPERDRAILYMRFFEDLSQSRIAARLGISQMHVSRLLHHICTRVRAEAQDPKADRREG
ncbi:SigB/SigF/SigG family RNA polymerase sigma factor [Streptomyces sp. DT195]|uniref:SigB/SigF/SigG family RNA polymerase sigma factor n=1 Tax=Streptomyces sp. DT195 TaxID=3393419 RepID=UPI003CEB6EA3